MTVKFTFSTIPTGFRSHSTGQAYNGMVIGVFGHYKFIILYLFGAWILVFQVYLCPGLPLGGGNDNGRHFKIIHYRILRAVGKRLQMLYYKEVE